MNQDKKKISLKSLKQTFRLYSFVKPYRIQFFTGMFFLLITSASALAFPKLLGNLVQYGSSAEMISKLNNTIYMLIGVVLIQAVFTFFRTQMFVNVTEKTLASLREHTFRHLIKLPISFFQNRRVGELTSRISADISLLQETLTSTLASLLRQLIGITGGIVLLMYISYQLTLFMLAILPLVVFSTVAFGRFIRRYSKKVQQQVAESNVIVEETLQGIHSVKSFANENHEINRYMEKITIAAQTGIKSGWYRGLFFSSMLTGTFGAMILVIWKGTTYMINGSMQSGDLFSFVLYTGFIAGMMGGLAEVYAQVQRSVGATDNLLEILDEPVEILDDSDIIPPELQLKGTIQFSNVSFHYPNREELHVLRSLSFNIMPDTKVALVGPSGAGKSTIVNLLLRLYEPVSGTITFGGKHSTDFPLKTLRQQIAVVPQDVFLFGGTIAENIAYGKQNATEAEVYEAAQKANALEFIDKFPEGFSTLVGERGTQLSGGQRQRIAIARAVLKNPKLLILDEATSALDSESERLVYDALEKLMIGRTSIVIAHRLATIRNADYILVLNNGEIVEQGSHNELVSNVNGLYKMLTKLQF